MNKYLDTFVAEVKLKRPASAAEVQHYLDIWIQELYHHKPHSALNERTPLEVFKQDSKSLRWATREQLDYAFVFTQKRLVDKTGCLSFRNILWEAGQDLIGMRVDVAFRPDNPDEIEVFHEGFEPRAVKPLVITAHSAPRKRLRCRAGQAQDLRELDAAEKKYREHRDLAEPPSRIAMSWRNAEMFEAFYGLERTPFSHGMDTDRLFLTHKTDETLARLQVAASRQWFALLTGDCGTGKSTLIRKLSARLAERTITAFSTWPTQADAQALL